VNDIDRNLAEMRVILNRQHRAGMIVRCVLLVWIAVQSAWLAVVIVNVWAR